LYSADIHERLKQLHSTVLLQKVTIPNIEARNHSDPATLKLCNSCHFILLLYQ